MKTNAKRMLALLVVLMLIVSAVGCGEGGEKKVNAADQKIVFVLHSEPDGIDPGITNNSFASPFLNNCFEGLVNTNENNELVAGLAKDWSVSEDGKTYTFNLRDDLKWSDGTPLVAGDFVYAIQRVLTPETTAQFYNMVTDYIVNAQEFYDGKVGMEEVGVKAPDDKTLVMTLKDPAPFFLNILAMWVYSPVQKATVEKNKDKWTLSPESYVVSGPFKISEMNMGESVVLVKNEHYWNAKEVKLEQLTFRYIKEQSTALTAFDGGEIDGFREIPMADFARLKAESKDLYTKTSYATTYYLINNKKAPYDNVKVRKALNLAIDRKSLIENVLQSADMPACALIPPGYVVDGKDSTDGRSDYDIKPTAQVEEARKLLAEAGYPDGKGFPTMELSYYTHPQVKLIVEAMAQMFKENLNINVEISTEEWAVYYTNVQAGKYDVCAMGWGADFFHPMTFFPIFTTGDPANAAFYENPAYDEQVSLARKEMDAKKAVDIMRKAEDILMNDYPFIPLYHRSTSLMMKEYVKNWSLSPTGNFQFKAAYVEK